MRVVLHSTLAILLARAYFVARTHVQLFASCASQTSAFKRTNEAREYAQHAPAACTHIQTFTTNTLLCDCALFTCFFFLLILHCHPNTLLRQLVAQPAKGTQTGKLPDILQDHDYVLRVIIAAVCVEPTTRRYLYCMRAGGHWILQIHESAGICVL